MENIQLLKDSDLYLLRNFREQSLHNHFRMN